jgi:ribonuclease E
MSLAIDEPVIVNASAAIAAQTVSSEEQATGQAPVAEAIAAAPAPVEAAPVVATPAIPVSVPAAVTSAPSSTMAARITPAPMPLDELHAVLGAAGLTLATTNPEKLRAAQAAAAQIVVPPRVPRIRKPLPPLSTEPLIQVETRQ